MSRLHYLYDQQGTGAEHFVYYCSTCSCVLKVRRSLGPLDAVGPARLCIGCGMPLEGNVECRLAPVPEDWAELYQAEQPAVQTRSPGFHLASSLPHFSLGFPRLDSLLRPLTEDRLIIVAGEASSAVAELAAFRAQLPIDSGGLDSAVLFIDGGNRSDPYLFSSFVRQRRLKPAAAMRRIATCRVFTFYQLADLVSQHLPRAVEDYGTKLVIISDLLGTFNEPELEEREARRVLRAVDEGIREVKKKALVVATLATPNKHDDMVSEWADVVVSLSSSRGRVQADLLKHRNRLPDASSFKMSQLLRATSPRGVR
ncbi:MAG TPA: hypothetical protein VEB67_00160 [Nitrososphaerales archaeon]|nr:hypothetical protein [Nitrososphaerales archaeon]